MQDETGAELAIPKTRKFPIALLIAAAVSLYILSSFGKNVILFSLAEITFSMSLFLAATAVFYELKKFDTTPVKISTLLKKFHKAYSKEEPVQAAEKTGESTLGNEEAAVSGNDLREIQKETVSNQSQTRINPFTKVYEGLYIILLLGIAFWRALRMFTGLDLPFTGLRSGIVDAVPLLVFPCTALIYLTMRKDIYPRPGDKTSHDMLTLFSYVSFIFAAVIVAESVLKLNILVILLWFYRIVTAYIIVALAFNIVLSVLKKDILGDFNYTLIPGIQKMKEKKDDLFDTEEVKRNFSLKSLYTIKYALKIFPAALLSLVFILFLSTTLFVVQPHQQALVYRLGRLRSSPVVGEGLRFKLPWPIDKVEIYNVYRVNSMQIGYESSYNANYLWTRAHDGGENTLLLGNGNEMVALNIKIVYTISDLYSYVKTCTNPEEVLSAAAYEALMNRTVDTTLDAFLSVERSSLSASVMAELSQFCASNDLGLSVSQVVVESIHPPVEIANVYQRVVTALIVKETIITNAKTEAEKTIINAEREGKTAVDNAIARQRGRVSEAQKEMEVYYAAMQAYNINPRSFEITKYLDTYEKIINGNKVYVFSPGMEADMSKAVIGRVNPVFTGAIYPGDSYE